MTVHTPIEKPLDAPALDRAEGDLHWLGLLDQLYALVEAEGADVVLAGVVDDWPAPWQALVDQWALRIGARSVQISEPRALQSPGCDAGFLSHRRITGHVISARSVAPEGFTPAQAREFHVFCSHLHTAWALRSSLDATQASLASLHDVIDALPAGVVVLDEHGEVVLLNRQGRDWLAHTERAGLQSRRLQLSADQAVFDRALHAFACNPGAPQALQVNGLDLHLSRLACAPFSVLLLIHERCDPLRRREIAAPPATLARHVQHRYGLTDKELPLAWNLAQGMPLKQYAGLTGRSIETLRAQLKSVFRKLGAADQKSLGLILFDALHAVTLQAMGASLAALVAERAVTAPEPLQQLTWR